MSSTTVAQQPLNFGPEWLRALSTPETTTPIPSSSGSASGGTMFKFSATKYRYSKDEILALRANVTQRLSEDVRNEIMENLKDVESVFRPNIIEPLTLTTPTTEETAKMNSLSSYISGRTPGGGGRGGSNSQQAQQHDSRGSRGGLASNGRGSGTRGRGGREHGFGSSRGNHNQDDNGDTGGGDETSGPSSSSWSRAGYHPRGGGAFANRVRSYDDREPSQPFRRGSGTRQTSDAWRRSRGDEDENQDQNEDSTVPSNGSSSWTSRGGQARRGGGAGGAAGPMEHRTKSNDKWSHTDDRPGPSSSYESNQNRGWRSNTTMSDRDLNSRRPQPKRERLPEWMNDNENDNPLDNSPFEPDPSLSSSSSKRQSNENTEQSKVHTPPVVADDTASNTNTTNAPAPKQQDDNISTLPQADTNVPSAAEIPEPKPIEPAQHTPSSWDDEFEPSDLATTVVEATLAEDHDYSPPISSLVTPNPISIEPIQPSVAPIIPQQRVQPSGIIDDKQWFYKDPQNTVQGPFSSADMERWFAAGYFTVHLPVKRLGETQFSTIQQLTKDLGRLPFCTDSPTISPPIQQQQQPPQQQQAVASESQKFNSMMFGKSPSSNAAYLEDYLLQQQQQSRQNMQHALFNRQVSMPLQTTDIKPVTSPNMINSQLQAYFASQQQSQSTSTIFPSNLANDPAIVYQQQSQLQRSISATNQQQQPQLYDEFHHHSFRQISNPSAPSTTSFFGANLPISQSQKPDDIMTRLAQAMQSHGQQQQEKIDEQRRLEQQRRELELERLKLAQQAEQLRLQREEEERRQLEQKQKFEEELRKKNEANVINKQTIIDQMKEMAKTIDQKKQQQQPVKPQPQPEIDPFLAFQQSLQFQKEQQAKIEAQKAENIRRYQQQQQQQQQQQIREQVQQQQQQIREQVQQQQQQAFKLPETANWARHPLHSNEHIQTLNFAEIQKQEQEQERRSREAALAAQQVAKGENVNSPNVTSSNKSNSWARTLFAGSINNNNNTPNVRNNNISSDQEVNENTMPDSPITSYNQQATNAPKNRTATSQPSTPWSSANTASSNASLQDIQRQQSQTETKQQTQQQQQQPTQVTHSSSSGAHSAPAWGGAFQHTTPPSSASSIFWGDNQQISVPAKPTATNNTKPSTPWTELKTSTAASPPSLSSTTKSNPSNAELTKSEREAKYLFTTTRTQDALSKWAQTQFKDNLQAIDVPTLIQLLKDIETSEEIVEYVQPYMGSVIKAREFASDFITKRKQLANAEPELDNERLHELAMAPTSSNSNSGNGGDEGFQLASNGQKKKAKKMKGQKIDVKQLGFMVNNRPEQREDIDKVPM